MINKEEWIEDWKINDDCYQTSKSLVETFESFLSYLKIEKKLAKRTIQYKDMKLHVMLLVGISSTIYTINIHLLAIFRNLVKSYYWDMTFNTKPH